MKKIIALFLFCLSVSFNMFSARPLDVFINLKGDFLLHLIVCDYSLILTPIGDIVKIEPLRHRCDERYFFPETLRPKHFEKGRYTRLKNCNVKYDFFTEKISDIGAMKIIYDFHTKNIKKIDSYDIKYDFASGRVKRIGEVEIEYNFFSDMISKIGEFKVEYNFSDNQIKSISTPDYEIEFLDKWGKPIKRDRPDRIKKCPGNNGEVSIPEDVLYYQNDNIDFYIKID